MTERHPIWKLADQIQMDLRNAQAKLVELRAQLASVTDLPDTSRRENAVPADPFKAIRAEIRNGSIVDQVDLQAAVRAVEGRGILVPAAFVVGCETLLEAA